MRSIRFNPDDYNHAMKCDWEEHSAEGSPRPGWRKVRCVRCGVIAGWTPHALNRIHGTCYGWPRWHEWGSIVEFSLAVVGITKEGWTWLRYRLGLTKPCGCEKRATWLDSVGGWIAGKSKEPPSR